MYSTCNKDIVILFYETSSGREDFVLEPKLPSHRDLENAMHFIVDCFLLYILYRELQWNLRYTFQHFFKYLIGPNLYRHR